MKKAHLTVWMSAGPPVRPACRQELPVQCRRTAGACDMGMFFCIFLFSVIRCRSFTMRCTFLLDVHR